MFQTINSPRRFNQRCFVCLQALILAIPLVALVNAPREMLGDLLIYVGLWAIITSGCLFFSFHTSYSARAGRVIDILEIPVYLSATQMFLISLFGLAPFFGIKSLSPGLLSVSEVSWGLLLTGVGLFSLWLGHIMVIRAMDARPVSDKKYRSCLAFGEPSLFMTLLIYVILVGLRIYLMALGLGEAFFMGEDSRRVVFGEFKQWVQFLLETRWFFLALITLQVARKRWPLTIFIFAIFSELFLGVLSGWGSSLIKIFLITIGCLLYMNRRFSLPAVAAAITLMIIATPIVRGMRGLEYRSGGQVLSRIGDLAEENWRGEEMQGLSFTENLLIKRQSATAQAPAVIMRLTPAVIPYRSLDELMLSPFSFIPRVLWPSKPEYTKLQELVTVTYLGSRPHSGSAAVTMAGNAYMYGGWVMVSVCMFILGMVSALIYVKLAVPGLGGQVGLLAVYAGVVIANLHLGEGEFIGLWQGFVQRTAFFLCFALLLCLKGYKFISSNSKYRNKQHRLRAT